MRSEIMFHIYYMHNKIPKSNKSLQWHSQVLYIKISVSLFGKLFYRKLTCDIGATQFLHPNGNQYDFLYKRKISDEQLFGGEYSLVWLYLFHVSLSASWTGVQQRPGQALSSLIFSLERPLIGVVVYNDPSLV